MPWPKAPIDCVTLPATMTSLFMNRPGSELISPMLLRSQPARARPNSKTTAKYEVFFAVISAFYFEPPARPNHGSVFVHRDRGGSKSLFLCGDGSVTPCGVKFRSYSEAKR